MVHLLFTNWHIAYATEIVWFCVYTPLVYGRLAVRYYKSGRESIGYDDWLLWVAWFFQVLKMIFIFLGYPLRFPAAETFKNDAAYYQLEVFFGIGCFVTFLGEPILKAAIAAFLVRISTVKWSVPLVSRDTSELT